MTATRTSVERLREVVEELYDIPEGREILKRLMAGMRNGIRVDLTGLEYYESLDALAASRFPTRCRRIHDDLEVEAIESLTFDSSSPGRAPPVATGAASSSGVGHGSASPSRRGPLPLMFSLNEQR